MRLLTVVLLVFSACFIQSCRQGCKDKTALNFDPKAKSEDGTCRYCKTEIKGDTATYFFTVNGSPDPFNPAIEFILVTRDSTILGNGCKSEGLQSGSSCRTSLKLVNLTSANAQGFVGVFFTDNNFTQWTFSSPNGITMSPPGHGADTIDFGLIDTSACSNLTTGTLNLNFTSLQFF